MTFKSLSVFLMVAASAFSQSNDRRAATVLGSYDFSNSLFLVPPVSSTDPTGVACTTAKSLTTFSTKIFVCQSSVWTLMTGSGSGGGGNSLVWRSAYSAGTSYSAYDAVSYLGSSYIAVASSTAVTPGSDGTKWGVLASVGSTGSTGANGTTGSTGTTGNTGPAGSTGANGSAATVTVGTVSALSAGASPTVTNVGSSSAATFNFGIPAGATGASGSTPSTSANQVLAGPATGSSAGLAAGRALVLADIPGGGSVSVNGTPCVISSTCTISASASLPTAATAGQLLIATGAGTTYTAGNTVRTLNTNPQSL